MRNPRFLLLAGGLLVLLLVTGWLVRRSRAVPPPTEVAAPVAPASSASNVDASSAVPGTTTATVPRAALDEANARIARLEGMVADLTRRMDTLKPTRPPELLDIVPTDPANPPESPKRAWGPEQAIGAPDTPVAGDVQTAWAPRSADGGPEWLQLDYEQPVEIDMVRVRETCGPGAITSITAVLDNGQEVSLWAGSEPSAAAPVEMEFPASGRVVARAVRVHLDTSRVSGWNEIDAVELVGRDGHRQWAKGARASSSYADRSGASGLEGLTRELILRDRRQAQELIDRP